MTNEDFVFLVVDDDPAARDIVMQFLTASGYTRIFQVANGSEALACLKANRADFIISDWDMPVMNGLAFLQAVRADPKLASIPFLIITSPISQEKMKVKDAGAAGVDGYLIKPFRRRMLIQKISDILFEKQWDANRGVLVVDDDDQVRDYIVSALTQFGYGPIFSAPDGEKGFELLEKHRAEIALVLSDWEMPKLKGIELLRKIRTTRGLSHTPFVMVTSQTDQEHVKVEQAIQSEVDHYLMKPFRIGDLKQKIEMVLSKTKSDEMIQRALEHARQAFQERETIEAEKLYLKVLEQEPNNIEAILGMASVNLREAPVKGVEEATRLIERAIRINPRLDLPYIKMAEVYESVLALEKAISYLKDASRICTTSSKLHYHLARLLIRRGRAEEGNLELEKALDLDPGNFDARELYGGKPGDGEAQ